MIWQRAAPTTCACWPSTTMGPRRCRPPEWWAAAVYHGWGSRTLLPAEGPFLGGTKDHRHRGCHCRLSLVFYCSAHDPLQGLRRCGWPPSQGHLQAASGQPRVLANQRRRRNAGPALAGARPLRGAARGGDSRRGGGGGGRRGEGRGGRHGFRGDGGGPWTFPGRLGHLAVPTAIRGNLRGGVLAAVGPRRSRSGALGPSASPPSLSSGSWGAGLGRGLSSVIARTGTTGRSSRANITRAAPGGQKRPPSTRAPGSAGGGAAGEDGDLGSARARLAFTSTESGCWKSTV